MACLVTYVFFAAFCLATVAATCNHICNQEYKPVCGRNRNGELKTFPNFCEFNSVQCENTTASWLILKDGICIETHSAKCSQICTLEFKPVCGRNQNGELKTFGNLCMFNSAQCENPTAGWFRLRDGACLKTKTVKCSKICSIEYNPICGRNKNGELKTFGNLCMFNSAQCENPTAGWFRLRDGACLETKTVKCSKICSIEYNPICGRNKNGELKTFGNLCMFNSAQCENPTAGWFRLRDGACLETKTVKCSKICSIEYNPICGRNKNGELKTFGNLCMFNSAQCENSSAGWYRLRDGACMEMKKANCNNACTDDYTPVCGRNRNRELKTFSNLCELNIFQCEQPTSGWFRLRDGACE